MVRNITLKSLPHALPTDILFTIKMLCFRCESRWYVNNWTSPHSIINCLEAFWSLALLPSLPPLLLSLSIMPSIHSPPPPLWVLLSLLNWLKTRSLSPDPRQMPWPSDKPLHYLAVMSNTHTKWAGPPSEAEVRHPLMSPSWKPTIHKIGMHLQKDTRGSRPLFRETASTTN